jgi:hypothetical protein
MYFFQISAPLAVSQSVKGEEGSEGEKGKKSQLRFDDEEEKQRTLKIVSEGDTDLVSGTKVVLSEGSDLAAVGDGNRTSLAVSLVVAGLLVVLELRGRREESEHGREEGEGKKKTYALHEGKKVLATAPSGLVEVIPVAVGSASVHHEVDGASSAENVGAAVRTERSVRKVRKKRETTTNGTSDLRPRRYDDCMVSS